MARVLIACEESQAVCIEFRRLGHEAYSCDLLPCSGGHPEWHLQEDVLNVIAREHWDMMIAFPPCTFLTVTANKWMKPEFKDRFPTREQDRVDAIAFFITLASYFIKKIAIENPVGIMSSYYRKPDQIIQPYYFGDTERKTTCLWLKNLPKLKYTLSDNLFYEKTSVKPELYTYKNGRTDGMMHVKTMGLPKSQKSKERSKTFPGIAKAMAEQWSVLL